MDGLSTNVRRKIRSPSKRNVPLSASSNKIKFKRQIPRHIRIWTPVTFARNALTENIDQSHIQVSPEGKVQLFEKRSIQSFVNSEQVLIIKNINFYKMRKKSGLLFSFKNDVVKSFISEPNEIKLSRLVEDW